MKVKLEHAKHLEQIKLTFSADKREAVHAYLREHGWYIGRCGETSDRKVHFALAVRENDKRDTSDITDEVQYDIDRL